MKMRELSLQVQTLALAGLALIMVTGGTGCARADVHNHGATPSASRMVSGESLSHTRVIRYHDGHKIVTRDATGTDITIQRGPGTTAMDSRFRGFRGGDWDDGDDSWDRSPYAEDTREAFRQRMLNRLDRYPLP